MANPIKPQSKYCTNRRSNIVASLPILAAGHLLLAPGRSFLATGFWLLVIQRQVSDASQPLNFPCFEYRISNKEFRMMKFSFPSIFNILYSIFCGSWFKCLVVASGQKQMA
jgi:hypothetical protein